VYRSYRSNPSFLTDLVRCQVVFGELFDVDSFVKVMFRWHSVVDALCAMFFVTVNVHSMVICYQELRKAEICKFLDVLRVSVFNFYYHAPAYMLFNSWPVKVPIEELFN
jgi:hypothetical protein